MALETRTAPWRTMNISSPGSPSRKRSWFLRRRRSWRLSASAISSGSANRVKRRTSRRNLRRSAGVRTGSAPRALLGACRGCAVRDAGARVAEERVAELVPALTGGRLGEPRERLENRRALVGGELVVRQQGVRGSLQRDEEVRIDHRPAHQVPQPLRHLAGDHTNFIVTLIGSPHAPPSGRRGRASIPDTPWGAMTPAPTDADRRRLLQAALGFAALDCAPVSTWLGTWRGIGLVAVGMARQGYDLALTRYADLGW